ncbi:hypothetical protein FRC01_011838, partial [Tulasnella sp. 417]
MVVRRSSRQWDIARLPPRPAINVHMALDYLHEIQTVYTERPLVYQRFLEIISSRARGRSGSVKSLVATVERIADLFGRHGHPDLIHGVDNLLPAGIRLYLPEPLENDERVVIVIVTSQTADEIFEVVVPQP